MSKQHAAGFDFNSCNIVLSRYCLDFAFLRFVGNKRARSSWIHCVEQAHRDIGVLGRLDTGGMQNFSTKVCQFGRFFKMQVAYRRGFVHNTGIVVVHAINVRPYLDFGSIDSSSYQRSRVIATATLQVIYLAVSIAADETLRYINIRIGMQFELNLKFIFNVHRIGLRILVRTHIF